MGATSLTAMSRGIEEYLDGMVKRANLIPGYLTRVVYKQYQKSQRDRWQQENDGPDWEGGRWKPLSSAYAKRKLVKYSRFPGGGRKLLIATGRLSKGVIGPSPEHQRVVEGNRLRINTSVPYAVYVDAVRPFSTWSPVFYSRIYKGLEDYLLKSIIKDVR